MELGTIFTSLCIKLAADLARKGYACKTVGIKLRYDDFKIATRDQSIQLATSDAQTIRRIAGQCLKRVPLEQRLRLLGVIPFPYQSDMLLLRLAVRQHCLRLRA